MKESLGSGGLRVLDSNALEHACARMAFVNRVVEDGIDLLPLDHVKRRYVRAVGSSNADTAAK